MSYEVNLLAQKQGNHWPVGLKINGIQWKIRFFEDDRRPFDRPVAQMLAKKGSFRKIKDECFRLVQS